MTRSRPGPHPGPPANLAQRRLPIVYGDGPWYRLHKATREPLHFGCTGDNRFDAPDQEYGILYLGQDAHCAFIETFGQSLGINLVATSALAARALTRVEAKRSLALVDLTGSGLARLGADERLCVGDHAVAQQWSLAIWQHPARPDGVYYRARHDPSRFCAAVFDRARQDLLVAYQGSLVSPERVSLLAEILDAYRFGLLEDAV